MIFPYNQGPLGYPVYPGFYNGSRIELEYDAAARSLTQRITMLDPSGHPDPAYGLFEWTYLDAVGPVTPGHGGIVSPLDLEALLGGRNGFFGFAASSAQLTQQVSNFVINGSPTTGRKTTNPARHSRWFSVSRPVDQFRNRCGRSRSATHFTRILSPSRRQSSMRADNIRGWLH
jgi:hypothetical protein